MLRILFAIHGPPDPATAVFMNVSRRAAYLRQQGHAVEIVTPRDLRFGEWSRLQPVVLPVSLAARDLQEYDVVIFHSHLAWAYQLRAAAAGTVTRPATMVAFHGLEPLYLEAVSTELARTGERLSPRFHLLHRVLLPPLLKYACGRADRVLCLNSQERAFLVSRGWADAARVSIVSNGVEEKMFVERPAVERRAKRILFTAQWLRPKGIRYLAAAFEAIARTSPDVELTCAGTGVGPERVQADFPAAVRGRVRVLPRVTREELARELACADVFMFPTLYEGFGSALLEAMAAALPVVVTPTGAALDIISHEENGVVVPFGDSTALVNAWKRLEEDPSLRQRLGRAARDTARRFEWDLVNAEFAAEISRAARRAA